MPMPSPVPATTDASKPSVEWRELSSRRSRAARHPRFVRIAHWINAGCVVALFISGLGILVAHPRLYWGEAGGFGAPSLIDLPFRRVAVGAGWPRSLHFLAAWVIVATGAAYVCGGAITGHFRRHLLSADKRTAPYSPLQRVAYLAIVFGLLPLIVWTGLAMSPALTATFPFLVTMVGGHQSARTIHFVATGALMLFVGGHVAMVLFRPGVLHRLGAMITASARPDEARDLVALPARRRLIAAVIGVAAAGVPFGGLKRARLIPPDAEGLLGVGETLTYATHRVMSSGSLAREFRRSDISAVAPVNGLPPDTEIYQRLLTGSFADWRLSVDGLVARPGDFTLHQLKQLRPTTQITHLACEEGWSFIAEWTGIRLGAFLHELGVSAQARYVVFYAFDRSWNSLDMADAMHQQTLLAYGMNGSHLTADHGAPLRLHIPRQLGYKQTKYLRRISVVDNLEKVGNGLGAAAPESGYSWYAGI